MSLGFGSPGSTARMADRIVSCLRLHDDPNVIGPPPRPGTHLQRTGVGSRFLHQETDMLEDFLFMLTGDPDANLAKIQKKLTREGGDLLISVEGVVRDGSVDEDRSVWRTAALSALGGDLEDIHVLDFECETEGGPIFVSVHVGETPSITAVEYQAAWEPDAPVAPVEWDRKRFVTEEGEDDALAEALNSDPRVRRTVRKLLSTKYQMGNTSIECPNAGVMLEQEEEWAYLDVSTTIRTVNVPLFGIVLTFRFGVAEFIDLLAAMLEMT